MRKRLNAPITITSAFRTKEYNQAIGGARESTNTRFNVIDFTVFNGQTPFDWATTLNQIRSEGIFNGGIGICQNFIHLDSRGYYADWSNYYT